MAFDEDLQLSVRPVRVNVIMWLLDGGLNSMKRMQGEANKDEDGDFLFYLEIFLHGDWKNWRKEMELGRFDGRLVKL